MRDHDSEEKVRRSKKTLTILLTRGPYLTDYPDLAVHTALTARKMGYNVNLFMYLDGIWVSHIVNDKDFNNPGVWLRWCIKKGVNVAQCEVCSSARDVQESGKVDGSNLSAVYTTLTKMIEGSDKVINLHTE